VIIRGYEYQFDEKRNVSNTLRLAGDEKDVLQVVRGTMKATSYVIDGFSKKLLLRVASWFV